MTLAGWTGIEIPGNTSKSCRWKGAHYCTFAAGHCFTFPEKRETPPCRQGSWVNARLTVARHRPQLAGQEVIRRPRPADGQFAILQLLRGHVVAVLVFLNRLGINQVGDINQHSVGSDFLAANFFLERIE